MDTPAALEMELDYRLRWFDFDRYDRLRPATVLDLLQDIATVQAEAMGIGYEAMQAKGVFWALVRLRYEVGEQPAHHEAITVRTWPHTPSRFSFLRDFLIFGHDGRELARATSEWVLMDIEDRKLTKVAGICATEGPFLEDRAFPRKPRKILWPEQAPSRAIEVIPRFSTIDQNGHVNNSCYPGFVMDALDPNPDQTVKALQIDFRHEAVQGVPLQIRLCEEGPATLAQGVRHDGEVAFNCSIEWLTGRKGE